MKASADIEQGQFALPDKPAILNPRDAVVRVPVNVDSRDCTEILPLIETSKVDATLTKINTKKHRSCFPLDNKKCGSNCFRIFCQIITHIYQKPDLLFRHRTIQRNGQPMGLIHIPAGEDTIRTMVMRTFFLLFLHSDSQNHRFALSV